MTRGIFLLLAVAGATAGGETPAEFEVATIKPSAATDAGYSIHTDPGGRFVAKNITIATLIEVAYDIRSFELSGGPGWLLSERYDIEAKAALPGVLNPEQIRVFCTALLASRFRLKAHNETRDLPRYALVAAKNGLKLRRNTSRAELPSVNFGRGYVDLANVTMEIFAKVLSTQLERNVVDATGATGAFDFRLSWDANEAPDTAGNTTGDTASPSIFTALREQYGLKVESQKKGPAATVVVDHIDKPSEN